MKYRTTLEIICDAGDKEDALFMAGEYLKGTLDSGVQLRCRIASLRTHKILKYAASAVVLFAFGILVYANLVGAGRGYNLVSGNHGTPGIYTVVPELKTQNGEDFKKDWQKKKDETVLEYIKN